MVGLGGDGSCDEGFRAARGTVEEDAFAGLEAPKLLIEVGELLGV